MLSWGGTAFTMAIGGGRRTNTLTAPRAAKGGIACVVMNTLGQVVGQTVDQRSTAITAGDDGQSGRGGDGGGVVICGTSASNRDGGNGYSGLVKVQCLD